MTTPPGRAAATVGRWAVGFGLLLFWRLDDGIHKHSLIVHK
ncbi:hypothetical protein SCOCK_200101 [Actinacidiphila cocklensis]|uniref:Uncharacterized protein n=1 Tax=Actinacidiphila cocklensis TaxID=887465 RepID=A0A9W4E566_9ACTN|nr:hypothetical protein SCOCK_200101 [Actinacidiphila cocklensis]